VISGDIQLGDDLRSMGMDSSKAIQLGVNLEKKLKQKLPTGIALHLTDVASLLSFTKSSEMGHVVTFDSRKEAQEDLVSLISSMKSSGRQQKQIPKEQGHIFLTGVTGFLGSAILASLLLSTRSKITCLGSRVKMIQEDYVKQ